MATLGTSVSYILTQFTGMVDTITGNPLLLIPVGFFVVGGAIGLVKRLLG